jgi:mono/diheme cytochrome c family protein
MLVSVAALVLACSRTSRDDAQPKPAEARVPIGYGTVMADVARRFELFGRAVQAARFELGEYQLGEISEQFAEALAHAAPPKEGHPEVLPALAAAFLNTNIPDLRRALAARDGDLISAAFARAATACNGCHQASGHGFIEVPSVAGHSIPNTAPLAR